MKAKPTIARDMVEMNEALILGSVRQHEFTEAAEKLNAQLRVHIAERKQAENKLRESEEHYRTLFELGPAAVYSIDTSGLIQSYNRNAVELWGREPALGETDERFCGSFKLFRPDGSFIPHEQCPMADVVSGRIEATRDAEMIIERPDGSRVTVVVNIRPIKDHRGEIKGAINCFYNISERKQAEELLRRNEALFSALVSQAPVGVYVVDARLRLLQVNPTALPVFKQVRPLIGREISEILQILWGRRIADQMMKRFRHTLKSGESYKTSDFAERRRDINLHQVYEWQLQRVTLPHGEHGVVCFFNDITERRRAEGAQRRLDVVTASNRKLKEQIARRRVVEKALQKSEQDQINSLEESHRMQEQLRQLSRQVISTQEEERRLISRELHDVIAQTLTGINVRLASLKKAASLNINGLDRHIDRTQKLVIHSVNLVHEFARELRPAVLDDLGLVPALHTFVRIFSKRTRVHVHLTAFAGVEQLDIPRRTVLFRVAQEALTNVARHARASRVEVGIRKLPEGVSMEIKDDGKSFQVERVLSAKGRKHLGLLGMRERVEMVGGTFEVESAPGQGTAVRVEVPFSFVRKKSLKKSANSTLQRS